MLTRSSIKAVKTEFSNLKLQGKHTMLANDVMRRIRYVFDFDDSKMIAVFGQANHMVNRAQVSDWLKKEDDPAFKTCSDSELAIFLNGLINEKRGKKEGPQPEPENRLTNNIIFMKLKIALNLKAEEVLELLALADFRISKHELSAFFRNPDHKNFRECNDQVLRNFLSGMQLKYRKQPVSAKEQLSSEKQVSPQSSGHNLYGAGKKKTKGDG
jgi:uncharacterized protein YehS (DUF1456 family)